MSASVATGLGSKAPPLTMKWRDKTLEFGSIEFATTIAGLENWLVDRALKFKMIGWDALRSRGIMDDKAYAAAVSEFINDCNEEGRYSYGSEPMMKILSAGAAGVNANESPGLMEGVVKLASLIMKVSEDDAISIFADPAARNEAVLKLALAMGRSHPSATAEPEPGEPPADDQPSIRLQTIEASA